MSKEEGKVDQTDDQKKDEGQKADDIHNKDEGQNADDTANKGKEVKTVPLDKFLGVKAKNKSMKERLDVLEAADKKRVNDKLLEDKNFKDLLTNKDKEIEQYKLDATNYKKSIKLEKVKSKISSLANKENAIDGDDILKFISSDDLLELEDANMNIEIEKRIKKLKVDKVHLFNVDGRSKTENGGPSNTNKFKSDPNRPKSAEDEAFEMLKKISS